VRTTIDSSVHAAYVYLTEIGPGGVGDTISYDDRTEFDLDDEGRICALRLLEDGEEPFEGRLKYVREDPNVRYDGERRIVTVVFSDAPTKKTILWESIVDLDHDKQIVGIDILMADSAYKPDDSMERLYMEESTMDHMKKFASRVN
jgi:uncharacterized protein YuzE